MPTMQIKTIIFDLGRVLVGFDHSLAAQKFSEYSHYNVSEIYQKIFDSEVVSQYERGKIKTKVFYRKMKRMFKFELGLGKFLRIWNEIFFPHPEVEKMVAKLKKRFRLLLLSNINSAHYNYIKKNFKIIRKFDRIILSYRIGARKPETIVYERAISASLCRPEEILYIDDRRDLVEAARKLGIHSICFRGIRQLKNELLRFNINNL
jgi:putative hydrolase of the HAD superfamily